MIQLLLDARKGIAKNEETVSVEAGFATVEEANLGKGIWNNVCTLKSFFISCSIVQKSTQQKSVL